MNQSSKDIDRWLRKVDDSLGKFARTDRRRILNCAARHVTAAVRPRIPVRGIREGRSKIESKPYPPGNLKRSIGRITNLRRSTAVFVGPRRSRKGRSLANDGYYAGASQRNKGGKTPKGAGARRFKNRFLDPAARAAEPKVRSEIVRQSRAAIRGEFQRKGIR